MSDTKRIKDLTPDGKNFNKGTYRGSVLLSQSLGVFGAGRSILVDRNNVIIAGNKTAKAAMENGIQEVEVVETKGDVLVAVRRNDIDLCSAQGVEMAIADNATAKANFDLDYDQVMECVESVGLNIEDYGLKDLASRIVKEREKEKQKKEAVVVFGKFSVPVTEEETKGLLRFFDDYFEQVGVFNGAIAELLDL